MNSIELVESLNYNVQSFLEICHLPKEIPAKTMCISCRIFFKINEDNPF